MTEGEYNLWKDMPEKLKDVLIQIIPEKAEVVGRLRSEAREGKAKAASPASQELKTGGGSPTVSYAPKSSDMESGTSSTQADNVPAENTNFETQGGSSTAQNEPSPNHQGLPIGGDHQVHNLQVNGSMADNEPAEHTNPENGGGSSIAQYEPPPNHQVFLVVGNHQVHNVQVNGSMADNEPAGHTNPQTGGGSSTAQYKPPPNHHVLLVGLDFLGDGDHQVRNLQVNRLFKDMLIPKCSRKAEVFGKLRSKARERKAKPGSGDFLPSLAFQDTVSKVNLWTSLAFISAPILLDREYYKDKNSVSHKLFVPFMICIIFSFTGAFCALLIRNKPKLAVLRGCYFLLSIVSMASALSIMAYALFWKV